MNNYKFKIGDKVKLAPGRFSSNRRPFYTVLHLLRTESGANQYRVKSVWDGSECEVRESELS